MNPARCTDTRYSDFLIATPRVYTATEAARLQPDQPRPPAHDAFTRLLHRLQPDPATRWQEVHGLLCPADGVLVLDDATLDKPCATKMGLVTRHGSGRHHQVVRGSNLLTLLGTDGDQLLPCDQRLDDKPHDGLTKNDPFRQLLAAARARGFQRRCVVLDGWQASLENRKAVQGSGWVWLTRLKSNRLVNPDRQGLRPVGPVPIAASGTVVQLQGYGLVKVFRIVAPDGDTPHGASNDLGMDELARLSLAELSWGIEAYHRGLKQHGGAARAQVRAARAPRNQIGCAIGALVRLEYHRFTTGGNWFEAKFRIIRDAVRAYLAQPVYRLPATA